MFNKNFLSIYIALFGMLISYAQEAKVNTILKTYTKKILEDKGHQVTINYKIYKGHKQTEPHESMTGIVVKQGAKSYTKMGEVEIVNTPKMYLKINHKEKAMLLNNGVVAPDQLNMNIDEFLQYAKAEITNENASSWTILLTPKGKITQLPFSKLIIEMEKKTYRVKRQVFYYYSQLNFSENFKENDFANVKLEANYSNYSKRYTVPLSVFNKSTYLVKRGKTFYPVGKVKNYELINQAKL